ncbi:hypothetical protein SESBI_31033 [Sesbania bispinosa]|nr:hypothetical protein SESBI_31033 [Sesbania bispinosa]
MRGGGRNLFDGFGDLRTNTITGERVARIGVEAEEKALGFARVAASEGSSQELRSHS